MSVDLIGRAVADLRAGRARLLPGPDPQGASADVDWRRAELDLMKLGTVVDISPIRNDVVANDDPISVYDQTLRPPWVNALLCYTTDEGALAIVHATYLDRLDCPGQVWPELFRWDPRTGDGDAEHSLDWDGDQVRWSLRLTYWIAAYGGQAATQFPLSGPAWCHTAAIADDGAPLDWRFYDVSPSLNYRHEMFDIAWLSAIRSLTFLNCTNVTLVDPVRPRPERRRLARYGVDVHEIQVFASSRSVRGATAAPGSGGVPLTTVRGHVARYGPKWGRGLLFGKYEGEFWIPAHARGSAEHGESDASYRLVTDDHPDGE